MAGIITCILGFLVAKTWQHCGRLERLGKVIVCRLLDHPTSELRIDPGRLYVKCDCGFVSPGVSVP